MLAGNDGFVAHELGIIRKLVAAQRDQLTWKPQLAVRNLLVSHVDRGMKGDLAPHPMGES